jgi:hypothetical protein
MSENLNKFIDGLLVPDANWKFSLRKAMTSFDAWGTYQYIEANLLQEKLVVGKGMVGIHPIYQETEAPEFPRFSKDWWVMCLVRAYENLEVPGAILWTDDGPGYWNTKIPSSTLGRFHTRFSMAAYLYCSCILETMEKRGLDYYMPMHDEVSTRVESTLQLIHDKSDDYGQSFRRFPGLCVTTRLWEKISRYLNVLRKGSAKFEKLEDTLSDMIGWSIIGFALFYEDCGGRD